MDPTNPWASRFLPLLDIDEIKRRTRIEPTALPDLTGLPTQVATDQLKTALELIYVPTRRSCEILLVIIERALGHCLTHYPDKSLFLSGVYSHIRRDENAVCISGLAGSGKTQLLKALNRMLLPDSTIDVGMGHSSFPLRSHWKIKIQEKTSLVQMFSPFFDNGKTFEELTGQDVNKDVKIAHAFKALGDDCSRRAYRDGVAMLTVDEMQFFTQSGQANTLVTKTLLFCTYIGIPFFYVGNYSLCHRLFRRDQEDRQRLLTDPYVLIPDEPSSEDWIAYLSECKRVAGNWLQIDPLKDGDALHRYSAGLKRLIVKLIIFSFEEARESNQNVVTINDIARAYHSMRNTINRQDVEDIIMQSIVGKKIKGANGRIRNDIWCPFDLPKSAQIKFSEKNIEARENKVGKELILSSMTATEKKGVDILQKEFKAPKIREKKRHSPAMPKKKAQTAEELLAAGCAFYDHTFQHK